MQRWPLAAPFARVFHDLVLCSCDQYVALSGSSGFDVQSLAVSILAALRDKGGDAAVQGALFDLLCGGDGSGGVCALGLLVLTVPYGVYVQVELNLWK